MRGKSRLDEMQELALLRIESRAYKMMTWGLIAAIAVQMALGLGREKVTWLGECAVLLAVSVYVSAASARRGIWDRHLRPDRRTNALLSLLAGAIVGIPAYVAAWSWHRPWGPVLAAAVLAVPTFLLTYAITSALAKYTVRRQQELETGPDEDPR